MGNIEKKRIILRSLRQSIIMAIIAGLFIVFLRLKIAGYILLVFSGAVFLSGLLTPSLFYAMERGGIFIGQAASVIFTWVFLVPVFVIFFIPGRIILLLNRKDPLRLKFPSPEGSFWVPHTNAENMEQYRRQY